MTLSWSAPEHNGGSPIIGYIIERYDALVGIWTQVAKTEADVIKATVADLFEGQSYLFRVAALNQCGQGLYAATTTPVMTLLPFSKLFPRTEFAIVLLFISAFPKPCYLMTRHQVMTLNNCILFCFIEPLGTELCSTCCYRTQYCDFLITKEIGFDKLFTVL